MQVGFGELAYVPTLHLRPAEVTALEHLSDTDKDAFIPIVLLKPWATASSIEKAVARIERAYEGRRYFLQCDPTYAPSGSPASLEFTELRNEQNNYLHWWNLLERHPLAIPVLHPTQTAELLSSQVLRADQFQRGFLVRICQDDAPSLAALETALGQVDHNNFVIALDVGWGRDILLLESWADAWIKNLVAISPQIRIVISGSSFPQEFTRYGTFGEEASLERTLYANLVRRNNAANLIYGDWGSARRSAKQGGGITIPRIDVPRQRGWYFYRAASSEGTFKETAAAAIASDIWVYEPDVWGKYVIRNTAVGEGFVIDIPAKATAARINMHIHQQLAGGVPPSEGGIEQDYQD